MNCPRCDMLEKIEACGLCHMMSEDFTVEFVAAWRLGGAKGALELGGHSAVLVNYLASVPNNGRHPSASRWDFLPHSEVGKIRFL